MNARTAITAALTAILLSAIAAPASAQQTPVPLGVSIARHSDGSAALHWAPATGADHYLILHSDDAPCLPGTSHCTPLGRADNPPFTTTEKTAIHTAVAACDANGDCSDQAPAVLVTEPPAFPPKPGPSWQVEHGRAVLIWPPTPKPATYTVHHTAYATAQCSIPGRCETAASGLADTTHSQPATSSAQPGSRNHFWVSACNALACSNPLSAAFQDLRPASSPTATARLHNGHIHLRWSPVPSATHYSVLHSSAAPRCATAADGFPGPCTPLSTTVAETAYTHERPHSSRNRYWVTACNAAGCADPQGPGTSPRPAPQDAQPPPTANPTPELPVAALRLTPSTLYTGEPLLATLTRSNVSTASLHIQMTITVPQGWSAAHHQHGAACTPAGCHRQQTLHPGQTAQLTASIVPSAPGQGTVEAVLTETPPGGASRRTTLSASANVIQAPPPELPTLPTTQPHDGTPRPSIAPIYAAALAALALAATAVLAAMRRTKG